MSDGNIKGKYGAFQHEYAEVNGVRLHYVTVGQGKLIMFAHGFPEFWYCWRGQLEEFGRDYQAVAMDMRGYNLSSKPDDVKKYQMEYLIEDFRALAEHLGHRKFILVAHDWGGVVAWPFASQHPDYLEKLIIINAPHPNVFARELRDSSSQQQASSYINLLRSTEAHRVLSRNNYQALLNIVFTPEMDYTEEDRKMYLDAWSQPGAIDGGANYYRASAFRVGPDGERAAPARVDITAPTLVIWGEKDTALLTGNLDGLGEYVSNLTIKRIPDGSHWVINEQPDLVNKLIRDFIQSGR